MWTKNIGLAIKSFLAAELPKPWKLVIAGYVDDKSLSYLADLQELVGESQQVEFVSCPSNSELQKLYSKASFCLFPPLNEDWGIVPLESMAAGKLVIACAAGGLSRVSKMG